MKKILNLAIVAVAALGLFGCANSISVKQYEVGGDNKISNGAFTTKGFKDSVSDAISITDAKTTKEAKVVKFDANSSFKLFCGKKNHGPEYEILLKPDSRNIKYQTAENYTLDETYYDINGKIATKYDGYAVNDKKYPKEDALLWTKYTYYDGKEGKEEFAKEMLWPLSPDYYYVPEGVPAEYADDSAVKFCKDYEDEDEDGKKVKVDMDEEAIVAIAGKLYSVTSMGTTATEEANKDYDENKDNTYKLSNCKYSQPRGDYLRKSEITKNGDTITYTTEYLTICYDDENPEEVEVEEERNGFKYTTKKYKYKKTDYSKSVYTFEFKSGGKVLVKDSYESVKDGKTTYKSTTGNKKGEAATGNWTNNNGLIAIALADNYENTTVSSGEETGMMEKQNQEPMYLYWNGEMLGDADYLGSLVDSIPSAATSTTNENKDGRWTLI